jgi:hypothetical protein
VTEDQLNALAARANKVLVRERGYLRTTVRSYAPPVLAHEFAGNVDAELFLGKQQLNGAGYSIDPKTPDVVLHRA